MKRNIFVRSLSIFLTVCMLLTFVSGVAVTASATEYIKAGFIDKKYTREDNSARILKLDSVMRDCWGFTLLFTLDKVSEGNATGQFNYEVCVHTTSGDWSVAEMFYLEKSDIGVEQEIDVSFSDEKNVDQIAIICQSDDAYTYTYTVDLQDPKDSRQYDYWGIEGELSDEKYQSTHPFVLEKTLYGCTGFTLHYEILEVTKGVLDWDTDYEVFVCNTSGKWRSVYEFNVKGDEAICDINWGSPIDVTKVAVVADNGGTFSFDHFFALTDAVYKKTEQKSGSSSYLDGYWSDTKYHRSGRSSYPYVLSTPIKKCKGFTVDYMVTAVTEGKMKEDSKFVVYYCTSDGTWIKGKEFTLDDGFASVKVRLDKPTTVKKVVVHCMNAGNFSFKYSMGVKDPIT